MADDFEPETTPFESFLGKAVESVPVLGAGVRKGLAKLESISPFFSMRHMERGEGAAPRTYEQALAEQDALRAQRAAEHPGWTVGGDILGNAAGFAALPAASMATLPAAMATSGGVMAVDKLARGGSPAEIGEAGLGGAAGGAVGYLGGKALSKALGKTADWMGIRAAGGTTSPNYKDIANTARRLELEPGGFAALGREQGIIGGPKTLAKVAERAEAATERVANRYGDLVRQADQAGQKVAMDEVLGGIDAASRKGIQPQYLDSAINTAKGELNRLAGIETPSAAALKKAGLTAEQYAKLTPPSEITHGQLQDWLATRSSRASRIANALSKGDNISAADDAFYRVYKAGRDVQDEMLGRVFEGGGNEARTLRRLIALDSTIQRVAKNRSDMLASQHPLGLIGSMAGGAGLAELLHGNVKAALPFLAMTAGKATAPYRANILTTALSAPQQGLERALVGGIPQATGAVIGSRLMSKEKKPGAPDDFEPEPPTVATKGK